jgi:hypothetical protein
MALSDQLLRLSEQAKQLEASAAAAWAKDESKIKQRKAELGERIVTKHPSLRADAATAGSAAAESPGEQRKATDSFEALRAKNSSRRAKWSAKLAQHLADVAEEDALDDIDFAIYAIGEAEYSILDAVDQRGEADELAAAAQ